MIFMRLSNVSLADYCFFIYFVLLIKKNVEMKKIFKLVLFFGVMAFGLSACSDDDDDKLSGVIDSLDMQVEGTTVATQKFTYDQEGRLIKVTEPVIGEGDDVEVFYTFTYAENKVTVEFSEGEDDTDSEKYVFTLDGKKAISFISTSGTIEGQLVYDGNKLQKWVQYRKTTEFTWKDGNITFINSEEEDSTGEVSVSSYENKANIDYNAIFEAFPYCMMSGAAYAGILGEKTKNVILPQGANFDIETKDGYITKVSFTEEGITSTIVFNYK